jgi:transposase
VDGIGRRSRFRWEFGWKVPLRQKLRLRKPRLPKPASRGEKAVRGKSPTRDCRSRLRLRPLRRRLRKRGIELVAPYRSNNKERRYDDKRKLRRYKRRWIVERTDAWLGPFRRLLVRHEHLLSTYCVFFYLACFLITLRRYF